jgi:undecaprenyl-diphosphatase
MLDVIKALIFGIVEGITEWLPISSTGHMIILEDYLSFDDVSEGFWEMFLVVVQLGAILAVVLFFWKKIFPFAISEKRIIIEKDILALWLKILVACIPAAIVGLLFDEYFERLFYNSLSVALALIIFGIAFIVIETRNKKREPKTDTLAAITYRLAIVIGIFQLVAAIFPGTSRSGATMLGALLLGISRSVATEFTFVLAIPVMFGASLLKLLRFGFSFTGIEASLLFCGMLSAFFVSFFVIRFLLGYIRKHDFKVFGYYRIVLGAVVLLQGFLVEKI